MNPFEEFSKCQHDFEYFVKTYVKINHPKRGLIPFELHPYQNRLLKAYEDHNAVLVKKFRQGGFTTFTVLWCMWKCMFHLNQKIFFTAVTEREAIHIGKIVDLTIDNFPEWFKPRMVKCNQSEKHFATTNSFLWFLHTRSRSF
jgi:hypothetical protein